MRITMGIAAPVTIFCSGVKTRAVYVPPLENWYCERCGARVQVAW